MEDIHFSYSDGDLPNMPSWSYTFVMIAIVSLGFFLQCLIIKYILAQPSPQRPIDLLILIDQVSHYCLEWP